MTISSVVKRYKLRDNVVVLKHFDVEDDWRRVLFPKHVDDQSSQLCVDVVGQEDAPHSLKGREPNSRLYLPFEDKEGERLRDYLL